MTVEWQYTAELGRDVALRPDTTDRQVWADTFTGRYHLPPPFAGSFFAENVLDLGANIGLTAAHYKTRWPGCRVVAVEMDEGNCDVARFNAPDCVIVHEAVGGVRGTRSYAGHREDGFVLLDEGSVGPGAVWVATMSDIIDAWFGEDAVVDFCKIDVEGAEWELLYSTEPWHDRVRRILVELHPRDATEDDSQLLVNHALHLLLAQGWRAVVHSAHPRAVYAERTIDG